MSEIYVFTPICDSYGGIPLILPHNEDMFEEESVVARSEWSGYHFQHSCSVFTTISYKCVCIVL